KHLGMDKEQFCDKRDGNIYAYVKIGEQTWMAENLDYNAEGSIASVCTNEDPEAECHVYPYGRLYDFMTTVKLPAECCSDKECKNKIEPNHQGICPEGWHIPNNDEWITLYNYAGLSGNTNSAQNRQGASKLKATTGWNYCFINRTGEKQCLNPDANGTDDFGLALLPSGGGPRYPLTTSGSTYAIYIGAAGYWWTATEKNRLYVSGVNTHYQSDYVALKDEYKSSAVYSIRCVKTE
ncbi:MAG: hypothetical protein LBQ87_03645, partial [Candidatus Fibromonas sp.]|nr:hypothetical protein [Candidatus Fibromonas sp.]